jgi:S-methylmethionine-dependent homocysteine/selenocysteine methylase
MGGNRHSGLPQLGSKLFLTDGGIETYLIFQQKAELPCNAAYTLLASDAGTKQLHAYFDDYLRIAAEFGTGFILESATWRANPDWASKIGTSPKELEALTRKSIDMLFELRDRYASEVSPIVISGCVGPRADAYRPEDIMSEREAQRYHTPQIETFRSAGAELVTGITITNLSEAIGIARAAREAELPVVISFTVETDGTLPTGPTLAEAIERTDAAAEGAPAYFMVNCAHPTHIEPALQKPGSWVKRLRGLRANASSKSHAELDESPVIDEGNAPELGSEYRAIRERFPHINVLGGCCGTDHRHVSAIARQCVASH